MKKIKAFPVSLVLCATICFVGCTKNDSKFYSDGEDDGLAIFSNAGNNVMTCYINGEAWHTIPRLTTSTIFSVSTSYEVRVHSSVSNNTSGFVQLFWNGSYQNNNPNTDYIYLTLPVAAGSSLLRYINSLQGKRLIIDSTAGSYFSSTIGQQGFYNSKANGTVYFQTIRLDSLRPNAYRGVISGIFEASFGNVKITKGRFDHELTENQFQ